MEHYRKQLKHQTVTTGIFCLILAVFSAVTIAAESGVIHIVPAVGDSHWHSRWRGFIMGSSAGVFAYMLICLIQNLAAMKDDKKLKKLYVKQKDERMAKIVTAARSAGMQLFLSAGLIAVIIAGYFSITVSLTILGCVWFAAAASIGYKFYYSSRI